MSQLRQDILTGRWVILATDRQERPNEFKMTSASGSDPAQCPFCPGHEEQTTPEILATGRPEPEKDHPSYWRIRVFENMYPALSPEASLESLHDFGPLFPMEPDLGQHEVVAYSPDHCDSLGALSVDHLAELLGVIQSRMVVMAGQAGAIKHILPFCNHGPQAGATLAHPHLQILGGPQIPPVIKEKAQNLASYEKQEGRCLLCDLVAEEILRGDRLVVANKHAAVMTPWASRFPYEMRVVPRVHQSRFEQADTAVLKGVAEVLKYALARLEKIHQNLSYNVIFHGGAVIHDDSPAGQNASGAGFHWHIEILPRLARLAGYEAGSGFAINSVSPERAARELQEEG